MSDIIWLAQDSLEFPAVDNALSEPDGLLAVGGDLSTERLIKAYQCGIFPWYEQGQPLLWWSPDPRCVLYPQQLHVSRSLKKSLRKTSFSVTYDRAFTQVITQCAQLRQEAEGTWITPEMITAFVRLHSLGLAHSVEVWEAERLVGGLYGIAMGSVFFGESMFSRRTDASKIALLSLSRQLIDWHFNLIDCQVQSEHLMRLGAATMPRRQFIDHLKAHIHDPLVSNWQVGIS